MSKKPRNKPLADWLRRRFDDGQRFLVLCLFAGLFCGLSAVAFHLAIHHLFHGLWGMAETMDPLAFHAVMLAAPTFAGLVVGLVVRYRAPDCAGSGIPQVKAAYYNKGGKISGTSGIWRFLIGSLYVGLGNALGREGPTVHLCAAISSRIGRWAFRHPARVQSMLPVGMHAMRLDAPGWQPTPVADPPALQGGPTFQLVRTQLVRLRAASAEARQDGVLRGRLWMAAPAARAWGVSVWDVDDPCRHAVPGAVLVESVAISIQQPDCLSVRAVAAGAPVPGWTDGWVPDEAGWLFAYERYGMDGAVQARLWLPQARVPGAMLAALWGRAWAAGLRPWGDATGPATAALPPLRP